MDLKEYIEHTLLKQDATKEDLEKLLNEAKTHHFKGVCVNGYNIKAAKEYLKDTNVKIVTVVGFPLGSCISEVKAYETTKAIEDGADEIDMVINITDVKNGNYQKVEEEIALLKEVCGDKVLKVIIETCYLTEEEKIAMCKAVTNAKADYIKTSTGFGTAGATLEDVLLMKANIGPDVKIKAAGGIRTKEAMEQYLEAGCDRIGCSSTAVLFG